MLTTTVTANNQVLTTGSEDQNIALTTWPDRASALDYAGRIVEFCGGTLVVESVPSAAPMSLADVTAAAIARIAS